MFIQSRFTVATLMVFLIFGIVHYSIQHYVIMPSFVSIEENEAKANIYRIIESLNREIDVLIPLVADWATWDDTYQFAVDRNQAYIENNFLKTDFMSVLKVDAFSIYNSDGVTLWSKNKSSRQETLPIDRNGGTDESNSEKVKKFGDTVLPFLPVDHVLIDHRTIESEIAGFYHAGQSIMLLASKPILTGSKEGPARGSLVMGRILDENASNRFAEQLKLRLAIIPVESVNSSVYGTKRTGHIEHSDISLTKTITTLIAETNLFDLQGRPILKVKVETPRTVTAQGEKALKLATAFNILISVNVLFVLLALFGTTVLRPLTQLTQHAMKIGAEEGSSARLEPYRKDEFGTLAREFDRMMDHLLDARKRLMEQSFHTGVAEMAKGILHNIGNAITPLNVRLMNLRGIVRAAVPGETRMAVQELINPEVTADRKVDLLRFLELSTEETESFLKQADAELSLIDDQVNYIQQILISGALQSLQEAARSGCLVAGNPLISGSPHSRLESDHAR